MTTLKIFSNCNRVGGAVPKYNPMYTYPDPVSLVLRVSDRFEGPRKGPST